MSESGVGGASDGELRGTELPKDDENGPPMHGSNQRAGRRAVGACVLI